MTRTSSTAGTAKRPAAAAPESAAKRPAPAPAPAAAPASGTKRPAPAASADVPALSAEEAKRADAFLAALKRKLQPCTKGAMELDELDKWFRTNGRVLWPKGAEAPPDFDMEAWLRAHGSRAGIVVFTRQGLKREILMVKIEQWVKPAKKQKIAPPAPRPPGKPKPKKGDVMKKGRQKRKHSPAGGSQSKKGKSDSDDFIPM